MFDVLSLPLKVTVSRFGEMHSILFFLNSGLSDRRDYLCLKTGRDYWKVKVLFCDLCPIMPEVVSNCRARHQDHGGKIGFDFGQRVRK